EIECDISGALFNLRGDAVAGFCAGADERAGDLRRERVDLAEGPDAPARHRQKRFAPMRADARRDQIVEIFVRHDAGDGASFAGAPFWRKRSGSSAFIASNSLRKILPDSALRKEERLSASMTGPLTSVRCRRTPIS